MLTEAELAGLATALAAAGVPVAGPLHASLISGGRSNLTLRLGDGVHDWVLRMPPRVGRTPSAHDVAREARVAGALAATDVPVAAVRLVGTGEAADALLGGPYTVVDHVAGATIRTEADLAARIPVDAHLRDVVAALAATLAQLHRVDPLAIGLEGFGRPDGYAARQLRRWSGQWEHVGTSDHDDLHARAVARLGAALPRQAATGIVHGDYRIDNTLLAVAPHAPGAGAGAEQEPAVLPRVAAVVDWELSTLGDPVADVAMMVTYRDPAFALLIADAAWTSPRMPSSADLAAAYGEAGGVELVDWDQHLALAAYKIAIIAAGIAHRHRARGGQGHEAAADAVPVFLERTVELLG
ncbi:phosphotransferase family protein [Nocardioides sp.]|uniref:phosphotransferase family protein n=1 Tax=Nocardioides sp. TaxID=35761 RepID=UPI0035150ABF